MAQPDPATRQRTLALGTPPKDTIGQVPDRYGLGVLALTSASASLMLHA